MILNITNLIIPLISGLALVVSIISILYTYMQNRRKIKVDLWLENVGYYKILNLCAFNPGYRSVALLNCQFLVNDKIFTFNEGLIKCKEPGQEFATGIKFRKKIDFPHGLKEGQAVFQSLTAQGVAVNLCNKKFTGKVKISGFFKTAQNKIVKSESTVEFDINKYLIPRKQ